MCPRQITVSKQKLNMSVQCSTSSSTTCTPDCKVNIDGPDLTLVLSDDDLVSIFLVLNGEYSYVSEQPIVPATSSYFRYTRTGNRIGHHTLLVTIPTVCRRWRDVIQRKFPPIVIDVSWIGPPCQLTDANLYTIVRRCNVVAGCVLRGCVRLTDAGLITLTNTCPNLSLIDIEACTLVTDVGVSCMTASSSSISALNLSVCNAVTAVGFSNVIEYSQKLRVLALGSCSGLTDAVLGKILTECFNLSELDVQDNEITDVGFASLGTITRLRLVAVNVSSCEDLTHTTLKYIGLGCPNIEVVEVAYCSNITSIGIQSLLSHSHTSKITSINLEGWEDAGDVCLDIIAGECPHLTAINLTHFQSVTDAGLVRLADGCPHLSVVEFFGCVGITDTGLTTLASSCRHLTFVNLRSCRNITDLSLIALAHHCDSVCFVDVRGCMGVTETGVKHLQEAYPNLPVHNIHHTNSTGVL
eukprot:m.38990 g.38990  ORF g.38990 m.38990 type:complete len:469 (-) comp18058_c0_seq1:259-1665(-)